MDFKSTNQPYEVILEFLNIAELQVREILIIFATDDYEGSIWPNLPGVREESKRLVHIFKQTTLPLRICKNWKSRNVMYLLKILREDLREKLDRVALSVLGHGTDYGPYEMVVDGNGELLHLSTFYGSLIAFDRLIIYNHCRNRNGKSKPGNPRPDDPDYIKECGKCAATFWKVPQGCVSDDGDMTMVDELSKALLDNLYGSGDLISILRGVFGKINGDWRLPSGVGWWKIERKTPRFPSFKPTRPIDLTASSDDVPAASANNAQTFPLPGTLVGRDVNLVTGESCTPSRREPSAPARRHDFRPRQQGFRPTSHEQPNRRPNFHGNLDEYRRPTTLEHRRPTTLEHRRPTTLEHRRPTTLEHRRPTTLEHRRPTTLEHQRPRPIISNFSPTPVSGSFSSAGPFRVRSIELAPSDRERVVADRKVQSGPPLFQRRPNPPSQRNIPVIGQILEVEESNVMAEIGSDRGYFDPRNRSRSIERSDGRDGVLPFERKFIFELRYCLDFVSRKRAEGDDQFPTFSNGSRIGKASQLQTLHYVNHELPDGVAQFAATLGQKKTKTIKKILKILEKRGVPGFDKCFLN